MKRKFAIIGLCALLGLAAYFAFLGNKGQRRAAEATKSQLVIAPDGTIAVPQNESGHIRRGSAQTDHQRFTRYHATCEEMMERETTPPDTVLEPRARPAPSNFAKASANRSAC